MGNYGAERLKDVANIAWRFKVEMGTKSKPPTYSCYRHTLVFVKR